MGLNILEKIKQRRLVKSNVFLRQEVEIGFHPGGWDTLLRGDQNRYWKTDKSRELF